MSRKLLTGLVLAAGLSAGFSVNTLADELKTLTERVSYTLGYNMGQNLKRDEVEVDVDIFTKALKEAGEGKEPKLTQEEMQMAMRSLQELLQAKQAAVIKEAADKNQKEGDEFFAANGKKSGVKTTESGLQYKVLNKGKGPKPTADSTVTVHYSGKLLDGTEFDSSYSRGEPATFGVGQVIPGWTEVLQMMPEGSKWEVYIPSSLAYGPGGAGQHIGPNATLVFEIELLKANAAE